MSMKIMKSEMIFFTFWFLSIFSFYSYHKNDNALGSHAYGSCKFLIKRTVLFFFNNKSKIDEFLFSHEKKCIMKLNLCIAWSCNIITGYQSNHALIWWMKNCSNISISIEKLPIALLLQCRDFFINCAIRHSLVFSLFDNCSCISKFKLYIVRSYVS